MNSIIEKDKPQFEKVLEFFKKDITSLRTGRAAPSLVEAVKVECYGTKSDLMQLASITAPEPQTITIKPWDKNILKDIERALQSSDLNINPVVDSDLIRINFPSLTEESRKELVKILHKKLEEARVSLRSQREKTREEVITLEKEKNISEDEKFQALKDLEIITKEYNDKLKEVSDAKEKEIITI
ncbi:MAG: ribosome recycling factor [Candidatus Komeilibacteria bacterium CG11_big_fil_rev_8_21_14_0_20_36_20]|uniref:Ribosome-recycling factor n=1 Tax=Candidatus Komeilibacteria bacterium CG11_big_fil_rev_8_21_14_0_20_36_20 TaxID=1974477 RepID=A0A2H0NDT1_9BACT|nr:MAG: ribosome recycling factor [Candidatus Komeilibacteria bacterium CG11_big_fil_rev_8_21_14_0_20_36_20]PIR81457.1 MAG: ribosome recycling factor [Candidatus Komeilibacteria bacterium CG10_big_fil_rev_8_21_14_0_10_36_65]PJC55658.1 MAG: ribosome recycling factor [Candidatus Komeilibacteria bacterium CG_4_9_14_0_2_um_filter_36_13]